MEIILRDTGASEWRAYLTGPNNFRYKVFPEYKANRLGKPKPVHLDACKARLRDKWGAFTTDGCEADDMLGVDQMATNFEESIICSIDKDLLQIPGWHYNFVKKERQYVSPLDGARAFYYQLLVGDSTDGIKGAAGIGPVKAKKLLEGLTDEYAMYATCLANFSCFEELDMNAQVLHIWKKENDSWQAPQETRVD